MHWWSQIRALTCSNFMSFQMAQLPLAGQGVLLGKAFETPVGSIIVQLIQKDPAGPVVSPAQRGLDYPGR